MLTCEDLINDPKCLVICNHSGGKDSQAMYLMLRHLVPAERLVVIHAHLPEVEWPGIVEHIHATTEPEHKFYEVQAKKTFFQMVEHRKRFPSPSNRQCTSDLKRDPIVKQVRALVDGKKYDKVLNCMGLRAQESPGRSKKQPFRRVPRNCNGKREWFEWLPIHELTEDAVFAAIASAGQEPHPAYAAGMSRLSCCFCIMSSKEDIRTAAKLRPELFQRYVDTENRLGFTMLMPGKGGQQQFLEDIVNNQGQTTGCGATRSHSCSL